MNGNKTQIEREKIGIKKGVLLSQNTEMLIKKGREDLPYNAAKTPRPKAWVFKNSTTV